MTNKTTTGSDAVALDRLEAKARAATRGQWYRKTHIQAGILHADDANYMAALDPTTVLALIAQARAAAPAHDPVVEANRQLLLDRSRVGISKYGTTLAHAGLSRQQLAQHALEEALDLANYLQTIIQTDSAAAPAVPTDLLNAEELAALHRFNECALDGEGYDVPKEMMQRLAEIGVVRRKSGAFYEHTEFGLRVLEGRAASTASSELRTVQELASAIWRDNYREESPRFEVLDTMHGVLSQIDNMVSGMSRRAAATAPTDELPACDAPKGPYADYSAEEVEAFAKEYARTIIATRTLSAPTATAEPVATKSALDLPTAIMNIPCEANPALGSIAVYSYQRGHRDARHAAADLVLERADELATPAKDQHDDDIAVQLFADAMKAKMADSRAKGRSGWNDRIICPTERLQAMLHEHLAKGDPIDVANFCMMLWMRVAPVSAPAPVTYLRWRACQVNEGHGNIDHHEWFEECKPGELGDDGNPAFPVYGAPVKSGAAEPIYQVQHVTEQGSSAWRDATEEAYHTFMPERRRIVYAAPAPQQAAPLTDALLQALIDVCNAALPVTNAAYNIGQNHEQWDTIKQSIAHLDKLRSQAHELIREVWAGSAASAGDARDGAK